MIGLENHFEKAAELLEQEDRARIAQQIRLRELARTHAMLAIAQQLVRIANTLERH